MNLLILAYTVWAYWVFRRKVGEEGVSLIQLKQLAWVVGLWLSGVAAVSAVAYLLRWWLL